MTPLHTTLMDREAEEYNSCCSLDILEIQRDILDHSSDAKNIFRVIHSELYHVIVPYTYIFPEIFSWLVSSFVPQRNFVMSSSGENLF